jgi:hypothetical protein
MTLPAAVGSGAGQQLTDVAGDGITAWAAAGSSRELKNIVGAITDPTEALTQLLSTPLYRFNYKPGMGTGDSATEYVGVMADEAPWAMHYGGAIVNPVNTLGYMVLGIQATNKKIDDLNLTLDGIAGTVIPTADSASGSFVTAFFDNVYTKVGVWMGDVGNNIGDFFANRIHTKELCVAKSDGTEFCANGDQLESAMVSNNSNTPISTPDLISTPISDPIPDPILEPAPEPEPISNSASEPELIPTPEEVSVVDDLTPIQTTSEPVLEP